MVIKNRHFLKHLKPNRQISWNEFNTWIQCFGLQVAESLYLCSFQVCQCKFGLFAQNRLGFCEIHEHMFLVCLNCISGFLFQVSQKKSPRQFRPEKFRVVMFFVLDRKNPIDQQLSEVAPDQTLSKRLAVIMGNPRWLFRNGCNLIWQWWRRGVTKARKTI